MKVTAINGSPRGKNSSTNALFSPLLEGMKLAHAHVKVHHLAEKKIHPCNGCQVCLVQQLNKCVFHDDMSQIIQDYQSGHLLILGTPIHTYHMSDLLKKFIDRTLPLHKGFMEYQANNETSYLTLHKPHNLKVLLVSNCGLPETQHFSLLIDYLGFFCQQTGMTFLGAITQPMGELLKKRQYESHLLQYKRLLKKIGWHIVKTGKLEETLVSKLYQTWPIQDSKSYHQLANQRFQYCQEKLKDKATQ